MTTNDIYIYLASASPRRRELLQQMGIRFERIHANTDESVLENETAQSYCERVAKAKAQAGWQVVDNCGLPTRPLLSADTTVVVDGMIYGKPKDREEAAAMLKSYSGRSHQVITSVAIKSAEHEAVISAITTVYFKTLNDNEIQRYLDSGEAFDKAGAYGIQGKAAFFIEKIEGSYTGVMGLPIYETAKLLAEFGYELP